MSAKITKIIPHEVEINLSGGDVAELFWAMDERDQSDFFNRLAGKDLLVFQLQAVTNSNNLTLEGRIAMSRIGEYSSANVEVTGHPLWAACRSGMFVF